MKPKKFAGKRIPRAADKLTSDKPPLGKPLIGKAMCGEMQADDGVDPREFFHPSRGRVVDNRKALQLCGQVADTLSMVLAGECDDVLRDLCVIAVSPAPDSSQLLVLVGPAAGSPAVDPARVLGRLSAAAGRLRGEVAAAITRRRAPKLLFDYLPGEMKGQPRQ